MADSAAFPEGTVISYLPKLNRGKPEPGTECPKGWVVFSEAIGRFVVGAGKRAAEEISGDRYANWYMGKEEQRNRRALREYELLSIGGEEQHQLIVEEIPRHSHAVYPHAGLIVGKAGPHKGAGSEDPSETSKTSGRTEDVGGGQSHNNLPPFIALYFCIKQSPQAIPAAERAPSKR